MKIRNVAVWSLACMLTACTTIYKIVPPGGVAPSATVVADEKLAPAAPSPAMAKQSPIEVETRIGHTRLSATGERSTLVLVMAKGRAVAGSDTPVGTIGGRTALVIDSSGSMGGARMSFARKATTRWIQSAPPSDVLSLVTFDDRAQVIAPATPLSFEGKSFLTNQVERVRAAGGTCISCGLEAALTQLQTTGLSEGRVNRIVLLSDGDANAGIRDVPGIRQLAARFRDRGVSVSTVGVGASYNEDLLTELAFLSNGLHHFVKTDLDIPRIFEEEAETLATTVATDVTVRFRLGANVEPVRVFGREAKRTGSVMEIPLGAIAVGQTRTVLLEVRVPASLGDHELGNVELSYRDAETEHTLMEPSAIVEVADGSDGDMDPLVAMRLQRSHTASALDQATVLFKKGDVAGATAHLSGYEASLIASSRRIQAVASRRGDPRAAEIRVDLDRQLRECTQTRTKLASSRPKTKRGSHATKESRRTFRVMSL